MKDRLIKLLNGAEAKVTEMISSPLALEEWLGIYADYLHVNGVIVPLPHQRRSRTGVEKGR